MKLLYAIMHEDRYVAASDGQEVRLLISGTEVDTDYGFESPEPDNQWIYDHCGIRVYRKYIYFAFGYCVAVFEPFGSTVLNNGYVWTDQINADRDMSSALLLAGNGRESKTAPWMDFLGISRYLRWALSELSARHFTITDTIAQIKNAYMSSVFRIPTDKGAVYLKITSSVYVNNASMEQKLTARFGGIPDFLAVSPDGYASITWEMAGHGCQNGNMPQYKAWLKSWGEQQVKTAGENAYKLVDCSPEKLLSKTADLCQQVTRILDITGTPFSKTEQESLSQKLTAVSTSLEHLCQYPLPNALCHADIRPGNIQILEEMDVLYDWGMAFYGHPFYDAVHFLHVVRRQLTDTQKEEIIDAYLSNWGHYGDTQMLHDAYRKTEECKAYFILAADYRWVSDILKLWGGSPPMGTIDSWLFEKRLYYFTRGLRRFIAN